MPTYTVPVGFNAPPVVAVSGAPCYFYGSMPTSTQDMIAQITSIACASNVATIVMTIQAGNIPVTGNLITVQGVPNASGAYNVNNVAIASITGTASTGVYTVTYACTTANLSTTATSGKAYVPIQETSETLAANTSVAIYVPSQEPLNDGQRSITVAVLFPSMPAAATVTLQTAINNNPSEYENVGTVAVVAGSAYTQGPIQTYNNQLNGRFWRLVVSGNSGGTSPTIIAKMIS